jgi:hypothetical protein
MCNSFDCGDHILHYICNNGDGTCTGGQSPAQGPYKMKYDCTRTNDVVAGVCATVIPPSAPLHCFAFTACTNAGCPPQTLPGCYSVCVARSRANAPALYGAPFQCSDTVCVNLGRCVAGAGGALTDAPGRPANDCNACLSAGTTPAPANATTCNNDPQCGACVADTNQCLND